ncbi:Rne/Rng family ribonuclease [Mycolicibacterium litorale]|uniref:Rne/Rng family ribonuclease n=1 Tax=Candidatus Mycolicibacterium alkanivorans TaxID=2954114 RepID=A0ABS9YVE9_9MYCO|nr:Rne/Rng family ribonuclease [Candidatus Mycolicibacterium alkanivorans]MCI4675220.1 Rne/Rng family ribonuclease [Candidatus Mycolicibacterium alkanivorans]
MPETPSEPQWESPAAAGEELPERLRVHSLARVLGTTSRRVLDALSALDGRTRSAQSTVDRSDAVRVRDVLAQELEAADAPAEPDVVDFAAEAVEQAAEPESRLILETATVESVFMPLFVAPRPVPAVLEDDDDEDDDEDDEDEESGADADDEQGDRPANRRRRRGRRGRGRGRGEQGGADGEDSDQPAAEDKSQGADDEGDEANGDEESGTGEGATRRRRRRRRRKAGGGEDGEAGSSDDPPNTVVHERAPREKTDRDPDAIQGISGSTRLEAKRQRRRDGREAGRRRPPILTEAEFLARREAVDRVMVVRDKVRTEPPHEGARYTQIAVLEDGVVVEHFVTSAASASLVGNIYLGIVQNVLPSMEAAFVDIGRGRNGVLYAGEVNWEAAGLGGAQRKIEQALKPGDYVVVQVSKDPVGHKGARLTTQVSLAGRYLVYVPGASSTGISRKLPDTERQRLKEMLRDVVPSDAGVIIRTASEGVKESDIRGDVERLQERWNGIAAQAEEIKAKAAGAAVALYEEPDVLVKVIRDLFNEDFSNLIVSGDNAWETINFYIDSVAPELLSKLTKYEPASLDGPDVFAVHRVDEQLAKAMDRKVWLPSGGTLVIDRTEAMTVVDVNTGKFTGAGGNLEQTVTKNNLEAAEEIVRQLRLRDIGGIVVIDFIDMVLESNRDLVLRRLTEALARDRTRHQVSEVTSLGLVQLTRKKLGTGLVEAFSTTCTHCSGRGIVLHADPVDTTAGAGRKAESGGRRSKRGKKARTDEPAVVARVPAHGPGEHPMFKAMAAANGRYEDDESEEELADELEREAISDLEADTEELEVVDDDLDDEDSDEDEIDVDLDEDDEDVDEDTLDIDAEDSDEDDDEDLDDEDDLDEDEPVAAPAPAVGTGRTRRRAAARPAGPPVS